LQFLDRLFAEQLQIESQRTEVQVGKFPMEAAWEDMAVVEHIQVAVENLQKAGVVDTVHCQVKRPLVAGFAIEAFWITIRELATHGPIFLSFPFNVFSKS
jgi:hypothetical protein